MKTQQLTAIFISASFLVSASSQTLGPNKDSGTFFVIDFSPVNKIRGPVECHVKITARTETGEIIRTHLRRSGAITPESGENMRAWFKGQLLRAQCDVRKINDAELLVLGKEGNRIEKITVEADGLADGFAPIVRTATRDELKPPPPDEAIAILEFHDIDAVEGMELRILKIALQTAGENERASSFPLLNNKETGATLSAEVFDAWLMTNWNIRRNGNRITILSMDGKKGLVSLKRIVLYSVGDVPEKCLPTIIATDNVEVIRGKK